MVRFGTLASRSKGRLGVSLSLLLLTVCVAGCSTPVPVAPPAPATVADRYLAAPPTNVESVDAATWSGFQDPTLQALIAKARSANLDVRLAQQRVQQARAGSRAAASRLLPTVSATGVVSDQSTGLPAEIKLRSPDIRAIRGAIDIGWELDLHGAARAAAEAAELDALAADAGVETAQWLATTEVARQYLVWQGARVHQQHLRALVKTLQDTERLTRNRELGGLASRLDVTRAAAELHSVEAQLPPIQALVAVTEASLKVLLGVSPSADFHELTSSTPAALPRVPALVPGQPIELLQRRPDLRVAQKQLFAEAARLRESHADQWPRFVLGAVLGQQDLRLNGLGLAPSPYRNLALAFTAPVFNAGRLRAAVERQSARERMAMLQYERAVLGAFQDVENSLVALSQESERGVRLAAVLAHRRDGLRNAQTLYREGQIDRAQLLEAQRGLISAELAAAENHTQRALGTVQLVRALGGGWYAEPAALPAQP